MNPNYHHYTAEQIAWVEANLHLTVKEMALAFTERFGVLRTEKHIKALWWNRGYRSASGRPARFTDGHTPWNKGLKGVCQGGVATQFKKGSRPNTWVPVGSERISKDGYYEVKTAEPRTWQYKHRLIWEAAHGPVPAGHAIIFADGSPTNLELDNLVLVTRRELLVLNNRRLIQPDGDLTKTAVTIARLTIATQNRRKNHATKQRQTGQDPHCQERAGSER